ncbi:MAG: DUF1214 domain-containing protein [Pseudomonadota bacterium]|nr:DUF1214 domain-containing protein [Pseudomonadota bacterium]
MDSELEAVDAAWSEIEAAIGSLGAHIRADALNADPLRRYDAYKAVLSMLAESYVNQVCYDRKYPESLPTFGALFNFAAPAPDFAYHLIHLEPGQSWSVRGRRGDAALIDVQQLTGWFGQGRPVTLANELFDGQAMEVDGDGNFQFILAPQARPGPWWKLDARATTIFIREYFTDYATQGRTSTFHVDRLEPETGNDVVDCDAAQRLNAVAQALGAYRGFLAMPATFAGIGPNRFQDIGFGDAAMKDQRYFQARFEVGRTEALVGTWRVPDAFRYWSIALYDDAYRMLDAGRHRVNLNHALAQVGADGVFHFVISHEDPGIANWLDAQAHGDGIVMMRTKGASDFELPSLQRVALDELASMLPGDVPRATAQERRHDLDIRRRHFQRRDR